MVPTLKFPIDKPLAWCHIPRQTGSENQRRCFGWQLPTIMGPCVFSDPRGPIIMKRPHITIEEVEERFHYNHETGILTWKKTCGPRAPLGKMAGCDDGKGYLQIRIKGRLYFNHRIAWAIFYGKWPIEHIDHKNNIHRDNRIYNLREATRSENMCNQKLSSRNTSGAKGIMWSKQQSKWRARITLNSKEHHVGYFCAISDAMASMIAYRTKLHGEYARHL